MSTRLGGGAASGRAFRAMLLVACSLTGLNFYTFGGGQGRFNTPVLSYVTIWRCSSQDPKTRHLTSLLSDFDDYVSSLECHIGKKTGSAGLNKFPS